jgi:hypothetical protein
MPRLMLLLTAFLLMTGGAKAHSPYFGDTRSIVLPNGQAAELRILKGDSIIIGSDPSRTVILDAESRSLARTPRFRAMAISCWGPRNCIAVAPDLWTAYDMDPTTFRPGEIIRDGEEAMGKLEAGEEGWGFRGRWASPLDIARAEFAVAANHPVITATLVMIGAIVGLGMAFGRRLPNPDRFGMYVAYGVGFLSVATVLIPAFIAATLLVFMWGIPFLHWIGSMLSGAAIAIFAARRIKRLYLHPKAA